MFILWGGGGGGGGGVDCVHLVVECVCAGGGGC